MADYGKSASATVKAFFQPPDDKSILGYEKQDYLFEVNNTQAKRI